MNGLPIVFVFLCFAYVVSRLKLNRLARSPAVRVAVCATLFICMNMFVGMAAFTLDRCVRAQSLGVNYIRAPMWSEHDFWTSPSTQAVAISAVVVAFLGSANLIRNSLRYDD